MKRNSCPRLPRVIAALGLFLAAVLLSQSRAQDAKPSTSAGQGPASSQQPAPDVLRVTTRMVVVDVVAVDKKGQPVSDLEATDFSLREDGRDQPISTFNFQHPGETTSLQPRDGGTLPPNMFRNLPKYQSHGALNVILIDALNSTLPHQAYVRAEMVHFLEKLPQGQPIAIYALGKKLRLLQDFTTDLTELKSVISAFRGQASHVLPGASGTADTPAVHGAWATQVLQIWDPQMLEHIKNFSEESLAEQTGMRVQLTLSALNSLARTLAGYPGRKNLIWISESIPMSIIPDTKKLSARDRDFSDQIAMTANLLADAQIAVYPIDARGLIGSPLYDASTNMSGMSVMGGLATRAEGAQAEELFQAHSAMEDVAEKTGGKAYFNRNDIAAAVRQDIADGATYYSIGYYPTNKEWNGQFRKIQVSSKRPGVKLRYRLGYFAVDRVEFMKRHPQQQDLELDLALNPDSPEATALQFQATVVMPSADTGSQVQLNYAIDPQSISFTRGADGREHAEVDCAARVFAQRDPDKSLKSLGARMEAGLEQDAYERIARSYFPCQLSLDLEPGDYLLRLAVRDNTTGHIGAVSARVSVPAPSEKAANPANQSHQQ